MTRKILWMVVSGLMVLSLLMAACGPAATTTPTTPTTPTAPVTITPQYGGVMKIIFNRPPTKIGYTPEVRSGNWPAAIPIHETIMDSDQHGNVLPKLANEWEVGEDGKSATFTLRKGIKFHDGTDLNAEAVKWNLDLQIEAKNSGTQIWESVDVIDDYTFRLNLSQWDCTVFSTLSRSSGQVASPTAVEENGIDWVRFNPVGSGPFKFKEFVRDTSLDYEKFDGYWQEGKPYLDGLGWIFISDPLVQTAALLAGKGQVIYRAQPLQAIELKEQGYQVLDLPTNLAKLTPLFKGSDSPYADLKVRQAVEYAIDKDGIGKARGFGFWETLKLFAPSNSNGYIPDFEGRSYNPEKARQLLTEAGYPAGFKTDLLFESGAMDQDVAVAMQSNLNDVGIDTTIEVLDHARVQEISNEGGVEGLFFDDTGANPFLLSNISRSFDPDNPVARDQLIPPGWKAVLNEALASRDDATIKTMTQKSVMYIYDEAMLVPLWGTSQPFVLHKSIHDTGFLISGQSHLWRPANAWMSK
ncbi:ABC transporter substrate-binding protein [Chloroflexota bacterium]